MSGHMGNLLIDTMTHQDLLSVVIIKPESTFPKLQYTINKSQTIYNTKTTMAKRKKLSIEVCNFGH
jgi:hypothetical protein